MHLLWCRSSSCSLSCCWCAFDWIQGSRCARPRRRGGWPLRNHRLAETLGRFAAGYHKRCSLWSKGSDLEHISSAKLWAMCLAIQIFLVPGTCASQKGSTNNGGINSWLKWLIDFGQQCGTRCTSQNLIASLHLLTIPRVHTITDSQYQDNGHVPGQRHWPAVCASESFRTSVLPPFLLGKRDSLPLHCPRQHQQTCHHHP